MKVLAIDLGASSGRVILGMYNGRFSLTEIHRFENTAIEYIDNSDLVSEQIQLPGHLHWDIDALFNEIKTGIKKAVQAHPDINSLSIDTWGCDFALIDKTGDIIHSPLHYRDKITEGSIMEEVFNLIPKEVLYKKTGIEFMRFNTIFQLYALKKLRLDIFERSDKLLFMPDLYNYLLTGKINCEYTIASTSALLNLETKQPDIEILNLLGIKASLFPLVTKPGTELGLIKREIADELGIPQIKIISGAGHDTAGAVAAAPLEKDNCFISCGTWSLLGAENEAANTADTAFYFNFTNEGGYNDKILFLKNISGLWLLQECRRQWIQDGDEISFAQIGEAVAKNISPDVYIDVERDEFASPGNLPVLFNKYLKTTGQKQLTNKIDIAQCVLESLALSYDKRIKQLEQITGKRFSAINIIGGGTLDTNLMQYAANACGKKVIAGPAEASGLGNIIVQLISAGAICNADEAREKILNIKIDDKTEVKIYTPRAENTWELKKKQYAAIIKPL